MILFHFVLTILCACTLGQEAVTSSSTSEDMHTSYGENWLYFIDDNGINRLMNFSSVPRDTQDMKLGDAYFYLYTRKNEMTPEMLVIPKNDVPIESQYFNKSNDIRVVTHGWLSSENVNWIQKIKVSLLREYDLNVVTVDWSELSDNIIYPYAAFSTRYVGKRLAKLLNVLIESYNIKDSSIHLIGHSLGAHVMGYAGMFSDEKNIRITGLDPARPFFEIPLMPAEFRLDMTDAMFVDIVHTCGGVYGYRGSYGHADFYPNEGHPSQPGCSGARQVTESCSHGRAHEYFEESIEYKSKKGFLAYPCESWEKYEKDECKEHPTEMGYSTSIKSRGDYFLRTRNESKYSYE